jgi:hypothetical protein
MTTSLSELRKSVGYEELKVLSFAPASPDTINFEIATNEIEEIVEVECQSTGLKTVYYWDGPGRRIPVALNDQEFLGWSEGLRCKVAEVLAELAAWEANLRQTGGAWDPLTYGPDLESE